MTSGPVLTDWLISVSSGITASAVIYGVRALRKFSREHDWLMETTAKNTAAIEKQGEVQAQHSKALEQLMRPPRVQRSR